MSLAGGTASLPITDPAARATPLAPAQWRAMLRDVVPLRRGPLSGSAQGNISAAAEAAHSSSDARGESTAEPAIIVHRSGGRQVAAEPQRPGYSSRAPLSPDDAPSSSSGSSSGQSWRSLGRSSASSAVDAGAMPAQLDTLSNSAPQPIAAGEADEAAAAADDTAQQRGVVVLDVRNGYEWDAGHFVGAERPAEVCVPLKCFKNACVVSSGKFAHVAHMVCNGFRLSMPAKDMSLRLDGLSASVKESAVFQFHHVYSILTTHFLLKRRHVISCRRLSSQDAFRETPTEVTGAAVPAALAGLPPDTRVMMYCTGGIRCDIYSAHLRKQGFTCDAGHPRRASWIMRFGALQFVCHIGHSQLDLGVM